MEKLKKNCIIFSLSVKTTILINAILVAFSISSVILIILNSFDLKGNTLSQSMLLVSSLSAITSSLLLRPAKKKNWLIPLFKESLFALTITILNLCIVYSILQSFSLIRPAAFSTWSAAQNDRFTFLLLGASFPLYLIFRLFFCSWQRINSLRKSQFSWALTYYFLVVIVITVILLISFFILGTIVYNDKPVELPSTNLFGRSLDWLVFTFLPTIALLFAFLFGILVFLIPPAALFSIFFAKQITSRLKNLEKATASLRAGDYKARSPIEGQDEIAQLQTDFNNMAEDLEQSINELNNEKTIVNNLLNERKELVASVSHELRTPITTIINYLDVLKERVKNKRDLELKSNIEIISQEINHLNIIVNDLFDLSKAEIGKLTIRNEACDISAIIQQVVESQKPLAWQSRHVDLIYKIENNLPMVILDGNRLAQILSNLVRNGIQHTPPGGIVQVSANKHQNKLILTITDTGEGIHKEDLPNIWKRFYKGKNTTGGNGIGLSVVKELVNLMEGEIRVKSIINVGSEFQVIFPIHDNPKAMTAKP